MTGGPHLVSVGQIAAGLAARVRELAAEILPNGRRAGHEWMCGSVAGEAGGSLAVRLSGAKAGVWMDFATGETGDALDLVAAVRFGGAKRDAILWAKSWLGLDDGDPARLAVTRAAVITKPLAEAAADAARANRDRAGRIFRGAEHRIIGTPVDAYLAGRGIDLRRLGRSPGVLGFAPRLWCSEIGAPLPGMVAAVMAGAATVAVHRTYLTVTPGGTGKAAVKDAKKTLGALDGGVIPLWRGASPRRWSGLWDIELDPEAALGDAECHVVAAEGIENALSVAVADPRRRVVAGISLANMASLVLPPCVRRVTIAADNDAAGSPAAVHGLPRAIAALAARGLEVRVARPPAGYKDFNAWLVALQPAGVRDARDDDGEAAA